MKIDKKLINQREHRINNEIKAKVVLLLSETGENLGEFSLFEAQMRADEAGKDLVQLSLQNNVSVCKIMDYGKFCFENKKNKSKVNKVETKEIQIRPMIDENDFQIKFKKVTEFLNDGAKVHVVLKFRGREILHQEIAMKVLNRMIALLKDQIKIEQMPKLDGKKMIMIISAKK